MRSGGAFAKNDDYNRWTGDAGYCSWACYEQCDPEGAARARQREQAAAEMQKKIILAALAIVAMAIGWWWGLRKKNKKAFWGVATGFVAVVAVLAVLVFGGKSSSEARRDAIRMEMASAEKVENDCLAERKAILAECTAEGRQPGKADFQHANSPHKGKWSVLESVVADGWEIDCPHGNSARNPPGTRSEPEPEAKHEETRSESDPEAKPEENGSEPELEAKAEEKRFESQPEAKTEEPDPLVVSADKVASRYNSGGLSAEKILKWLKSQKISESERARFRELLEERNVPLAETERKMNEEAKRKKEAEAEARRKADEEAEAKRKAEEEAEAKRRAEEQRKAEELKKRREQAEADRKVRMEAQKRKEEDARKAREDAERRKRQQEEEDNRKRRETLDKFSESMKKLSEATAKKAEMDMAEGARELEEANADNPLFRKGGLQPENPGDMRRTAAEELLRSAEGQGRSVGERRRAEMEKAQWRAAKQRDLEEAQKGEQTKPKVVAFGRTPFRRDVDIEDDEPAPVRPQTGYGDSASRAVPVAVPAAMPDSMVDQLAAGIKMSVQSGQMTTAQAAFMLESAMLSEAQKAKVRKLLADQGIALPGGQ